MHKTAQIFYGLNNRTILASAGDGNPEQMEKSQSFYRAVTL